MSEDGDTFLVKGLDLPDELESDFRLARNLFSVGFDDIGVLIAGRGLEGVLRNIARVRKILVVDRGKQVPAHELDLNDLVEAIYHLRWKATSERLISIETRNLLHYLRSLRNAGAHSQTKSSRLISPRETAIIFVQTANQLWKNARNTHARLTETTIQRTW